jgi:hypothetical protein
LVQDFDFFSLGEGGERGFDREKIGQSVASEHRKRRFGRFGIKSQKNYL